jgi:hypothetical protein
MNLTAQSLMPFTTMKCRSTKNVKSTLFSVASSGYLNFYWHGLAGSISNCFLSED